MTDQDFRMASGRKFRLPFWDPLVAAHFTSPHSYAKEVIDQIEQEGLYAKYFSVQQDLVFLDLGANIGLVSLYAADACKRIVAVEPYPPVFQVLKCLTVNFPKIECVCAALSPKDGECEFFHNNLNSTANSTVNPGGGEKIAVRGVSLNSLLHEQQLTHVDFCKVDVEGAEGEALSAAELHCARNIVDAYFIEAHNCPKTTWEHKLGELTANLARAGYKHMEIEDKGIYARK